MGLARDLSIAANFSQLRTSARGKFKVQAPTGQLFSRTLQPLFHHRQLCAFTAHAASPVGITVIHHGRAWYSRASAKLLRSMVIAHHATLAAHARPCMALMSLLTPSAADIHIFFGPGMQLFCLPFLAMMNRHNTRQAYVQASAKTRTVMSDRISFDISGDIDTTGVRLLIGSAVTSYGELGKLLPKAFVVLSRTSCHSLRELLSLLP
ncbi:hypothetical protein EK21DRAFT_83555 [Setomelanomma holmii]|uniref:Uncharacterized protein n=1 Tax=Setomelanomma holmii TaxID=210430 RepID=A0A9P4HN81_9PLEO|nr:hypothetical protein EK21DRAFT_83555 [Setomelanomma holmii]